MSLDCILTRRVVPAATVDDVDQALPLAGALLEAGLDIIEITFRTEAAGGAIKRIVNEFPEMRVGAGTVLTVDQAQAAVDAGAKFIVSPGISPRVVEFCLERDIPVLPGVATASEIATAFDYDLRVVYGTLRWTR